MVRKTKLLRKKRRSEEKKQKTLKKNKMGTVLIPSKNVYRNSPTFNIDPALANEITFGQEILPSKNMYDSTPFNDYIDPRIANEITFGREILPSKNMYNGYSGSHTTNLIIVDPELASQLLHSRPKHSRVYQMHLD